MEVLHPRCAGIDISKRDAKVAVRIAGRGKPQVEVRTFGSMTADVLGLRDWLVDHQVSCVVMEATGDYWKQFYYLLEDAGFELILANATQVRNLPGRKSDVSDAQWLAELGAHGLVRASFVPGEPIRELRQLTRLRTHLTREQARDKQRLEKVLEDAGTKLAAALEGRFSDNHGFMVTMLLDRIDRTRQDIAEINARIDDRMAPYQRAKQQLESIPGLRPHGAESPTPDP